METQKINKRKVARIQYYVYCPLCDKEIRGNNVKQVQYALENHLNKCEKKNEKTNH